MTYRTFLRAALVAGLVLALAALLIGCSAPAKSATPGAAAEGSASAPVDPPTIKLVEPAEGATVPAGEVTVAVEATGLKFTMPSNKNVAGEGHVHFTLDDRPFEMSVEPSMVLKDVEAGEHKLIAELVQNNTESFDPPVEQEITFTAE